MKRFMAADSGALPVDLGVLGGTALALALSVTGIVAGGGRHPGPGTPPRTDATAVQPAFQPSDRIRLRGPVHASHSDAWLVATLAAWGDPGRMSDGRLRQVHRDSAAYVADQQGAGVTDRIEYEAHLDYLGVAEAALRARGLECPASATHYDAALAIFDRR
ncbi:hypothetical protein MWU52_10835 [Jannaschia sp. S6380]|uniref:hypothetical protein n=1 Tax=Jannaschia sp. S6380 TaxID=2926408 RepID=UPI001FF53519|nr:hypothetical protein [Jannaschia sp. S6380]MCK0168047.1 hypothetical protein [Jannaschia sp. S6380]